METLKLATAALLAALAAIPARAKPPASLCRAPEPVLFTCHIGIKLVSICGQEQGGAAYRYGQPGRGATTRTLRQRLSTRSSKS